MLICKECGNENQLGRVFCSKCGAKLDLSNMTSENITESQEKTVHSKLWLKVLIGFIVILVIFAGLILWSDTNPIGEKGTRVGGRRVQNRLKVVKRIRKKQSLNIPFKEKDINGFFSFFKTKKLNIKSFSVSINKNHIVIHILSPLCKQMDIGNYKFEPNISYKLVCVPAGGQLVVQKAKIGHLPLLGPMKNIASKAVIKILTGEKEWSAFKYISKISLKENNISVLIKK